MVSEPSAYQDYLHLSTLDGIVHRNYLAEIMNYKEYIATFNLLPHKHRMS